MSERNKAVVRRLVEEVLNDGTIIHSWGLEDTMSINTTVTFACSLSEEDLAQRSQELARDLFAYAEQVDELDDGYAWRFPGDGEWHTKLLNFVAAERRCCAFFRIELVFEPGLGPLWLRLRGPDGTKAFITETFVAR